VLHAGDVKQRRRIERHRVGGDVLPDCTADRGEHHAAVRVHAALRTPGGARRVEDGAQIAGARGEGIRLAPDSQRIAPGNDFAPADFLPRRGERIGHRQRRGNS
jgi:hypothetical protein